MAVMAPFAWTDQKTAGYPEGQSDWALSYPASPKTSFIPSLSAAKPAPRALFFRIRCIQDRLGEESLAELFGECQGEVLRWKKGRVVV